MAEIDPVILELRADLGKYRADLQSTTSQVQRLLGNQEKSARRLEAQMRKSSGAIGASLRGLAGTLGTYFTGRELTGLIDSFTRLQNSLRVAGLEGSKLESVQSQLLDLSTRYGVGIEGLANLYGKATDAGRSFGASEAEILQLTEATSQALLITGTSAAQAQGAILGLSQALASGTVRAEEYNQINEGGLRPLLQAAAASEKYGGDINKLRTAVLAGKVSSAEFFAAIQSGSAQLSGQASKATLTLSGAFEALTSSLTVYVGQSAQANGVTQALAGAMQLLAENLDSIIPALAIIATVLGGRFLAGALAGGTALRTLAAYASIATTSLAGTALAARSAGAALLTALGGPVGVAIAALVLGLAYVAAKSGEAAQATGEYAKQADALAKIQDKVTDATERLASATGKARAEALANARALREETKQYLANAQAALIAAEAKAIQARNQARQELQSLPVNSGAGGGPDRLNGVLQRNSRQVIDANANVKQAQANIIQSQAEIARLGKIIDAAAPPAVAAVGDGKKPKGPKGGGASGPSISDINDRFESELASIAQQTISARQSLATSAEDRAELELRAVEAARVEALRSLSADKDYSEAQKVRVKDALDNLAEFERERIARDLRVASYERAAELADTEFRVQSEALRQQYDLAESQAERRDLAFKIIDLEYRHQEAALKALIAVETIAGVETERAKVAKIQLAALQQSRGATMESARRDTAGPLESYFDNAKKDANELNEAYQQIAVDGLGSVTDALTETATGFLKLGGTAGKVIDGIISDLIRLFIQQQITGLFGSLFGPSAASKQGAASGIAAGVGKFFGRASGGWVAPGQTVRVNESRGGAEYLRMGSKGGTVIPLGQVNQQASQPTSARQGPIELRVYADEGAFISRVEAISEGKAVEVTMAAAGPLTDRAVQTTMSRLNRPRMPGAGR